MMRYPGSRTQEKYIRSITRRTAASLEETNPELKFTQIISLVSTIIKNLAEKFDDCRKNVDTFKSFINQGDESEIGDIAGYKCSSKGSAGRALARYYNDNPPDNIESLLENENFLKLQKTIFEQCFAEICQANRPREKRQNEENEFSSATSESSHSDDTPGGSPHSSGDEKGKVKRVRFAKKLTTANDEKGQNTEGASAATGRD